MPDSVIIEYHGAALFKITSNTGKKVVIDPYIKENPGCQKGLDYFADADLVLITHGAWDHLGDGLELLQQSQSSVICGKDVGRYLKENGIDAKRVMNSGYGHDHDFAGCHVKGVLAFHSSSVQLGKETIYGYPLGYVLTMDNGVRMYHGGDTSIYGDMKLIGLLYRPNIMAIGVAGVRKGAGNEMTPAEAAMAVQWVGPDVAIPMHYPPGAAEPKQFAECVKMIAPTTQPVILEPGSKIVYTKSQTKFG